MKDAQRAVYELRQDLQDAGKPDDSCVQITKFQKQNKIRQYPLHYSHDCAGMLEQLRHVFMSKVEQMKLNVEMELSSSNHKRKLQEESDDNTT